MAVSVYFMLLRSGLVADPSPSPSPVANFNWRSGMAVSVCFRLLRSGLVAGTVKIATGYGRSGQRELHSSSRLPTEPCVRVRTRLLMSFVSTDED